MSEYIKKVNTLHEVPFDAYVLYRLTGGIFYILQKDYPHFIFEWVEHVGVPCLTMYLTYTQSHSLILDLDFKSTNQNIEFVSDEILNIIQTILKMTFIPIVSNFTYIIAPRSNHGGIHIHLPEFQVAHDDYILFCESLQANFNKTLQSGDKYNLDILRNAMLPGASKHNKAPYEPYKIVYIDEVNTFSFYANCGSLSVKRLFKRRNDNEKSLFHRLINCNSTMLFTYLKQFMMPVVTTVEPVYTLVYETIISKTSGDPSGWVDVATYTDKKRNVQCITKNKNWSLNKSHLMKSYHLKQNIRRIELFESNNHSLIT